MRTVRAARFPLPCGQSTVRTASDGAGDKTPGTCSNCVPVLKVVVALLVAAGLACAAAPASTPTRTVPLGVKVAGIRVGGLSAEPARLRIETALNRFIRIVYQGRTNWVDTASAGAKVDVDAAVASALAATPGSRIAVPVAYSRAKAARIVTALAKRYDRAPLDARVTGGNA